MSVRNIPCQIGADLVLSPTSQQSGPSIAIVQVVINDDAATGKTGVINWSGCPQAFLTFDPTGNQVLSYTLTSADPAALQSVENILRVL